MAPLRDEIARVIVEEDGDGAAWERLLPEEREANFGSAYAAADRLLAESTQTLCPACADRLRDALRG